MLGNRDVYSIAHGTELNEIIINYNSIVMTWFFDDGRMLQAKIRCVLSLLDGYYWK